MIYKIRFFLENGKPMCEQYCFATVKSRHLPQQDAFIYLGEGLVKDNHGQGIDPTDMYQVTKRVFCYNNYADEKDNLTSVEVSVRKREA